MSSIKTIGILAKLGKKLTKSILITLPFNHALFFNWGDKKETRNSEKQEERDKKSVYAIFYRI